MKMFCLVFLTLIGFCFADKFDYYAEQENSTWTSVPNNPYFVLLTNGSECPIGINYLQNIEPTTLLVVRVVFGDVNGPLDAINAELTKLTLCEILDRDLDDPLSSQRRYNMASSLGLRGKRCPIEKGIKFIEPYNFPTRFSTKDLGQGDRYYTMRIETMNQSLEDEPMMELRVYMKLQKENGTYAGNSSSNLSLSPIIASIILISSVPKFIK